MLYLNEYMYSNLMLFFGHTDKSIKKDVFEVRNTIFNILQYR